MGWRWKTHCHLFFFSSVFGEKRFNLSAQEGVDPIHHDNTANSTRPRPPLCCMARVQVWCLSKRPKIEVEARFCSSFDFGL